MHIYSADKYFSDQSIVMFSVYKQLKYEINLRLFFARVKNSHIC